MTPRTESFLAALQLADSAFPTGSFAHSLGLEACQGAGELRGERDLRRIAGVQLDSLSTSDCVAVRAVYETNRMERITQADALLAATKATRELREANAATGRQFLRSFAALRVGDELVEEFALAVRSGRSPGSYAIGFGLASRATGMSEDGAVLAYLFSSAASLVAAGQKLVPLGGGAAQKVLFDLSEEITASAKRSREIPVEGMYSFAPMLDVRSMHHERQRTRLYIS